MLGELNSHLKRIGILIGIFLITAALIAATVGCDGEGARYSLTMAVAGGNGTATDLTNASPYVAGSAVSIEAVAAAGYRFVSWTAPGGTFDNASAAETTFTMPSQNITVTANFAPFAGGTGTAEDPYQITDWYQLDNVRNYVDSCFVLLSNLDSKSAGYAELVSPTANGGNGWQPIGNFNDIFSGTFDGQGYEIRDLFINRPDESLVGLFGHVGQGVNLTPGVIENLGLTNCTVTGDVSTGGLVGSTYGTVTDCYATGTVNGNFSVGGLMGTIDEGGYVSISHFAGNVTGNGGVGGLVGSNDGGTVVNCYAAGYATGNVTVGGTHVGGLLGDNGGTVTNCHATGSVAGTDAVGGLEGGDFGTVTNCYATGNVTADWAVGGLVGASYGTAANCYATGSVAGTDQVGGLVGDNQFGTVINSYATGSVTGNSSVGGLVGEGLNITVSNSFWGIETSGQATSDGGTGKNTTEMQDIATFSGAAWNIIAVALNETDPAYIWNIVNNVTYPFLSWQPV
jgi:uncharacterized repeat protein (TIGR02543 family)